MKVLDYNVINWSEHFYLSDSSPSGLCWNRVVLRGKSYSVVVKNIGDQAGTILTKTNKLRRGWSVKLNNCAYSVNRIIWVMLNGSLSAELVIDHLDGNPLNNLHSNLALKTPRANFQNKKMYSNNTSGYVGIRFIENRGLGRWEAQWYDLSGCRQVSRYSVKEHGYEFAKLCAIHKRRNIVENLNLEGMNYTDRHGT